MCPRVTEWHQVNLGLVRSVLPETTITCCMYSKTHLCFKQNVCHQTMHSPLIGASIGKRALY